MKIFGLAGWSGSGKTTLVQRLLPVLVARGVTVSTMKHAHHAFDVDKPGKDSYVHREAGATEVLVTSSKRWALMHENRSGPEPEMADLIEHMSPVDLLLVEGFKAHVHDKLEIHRPSVEKPLLANEDPHIVAIATDDAEGVRAVAARSLPILDLNDIPSVAAFVVDHCNLAQSKQAVSDGAA